MALSDQQAREVLIQAYTDTFGHPPTLPTLQIAQAIARYESRYGNATFLNKVTGERIGNTNNWGAVTCGSQPPCPEGCFEASDARITSAGRVEYQTCFRKFSTPLDGAKFFVRTLFIGGKQGSKWDRRPLHQAAQDGDIERVAQLVVSTAYSVNLVSNVEKAIRIHTNELGKAFGEAPPSPKAEESYGS